jgi:hypothetical protein
VKAHRNLKLISNDNYIYDHSDSPKESQVYTHQTTMNLVGGSSGKWRSSQANSLVCGVLEGL